MNQPVAGTAHPRTLDPEQTIALDAFTSAGGGVLSYAELEQLGVRRPATVGYELAAAGWPIVRTVATDCEGRRHLGLRMRPLAGPAPQVPEPSRAPRGRRLAGLFSSSR